MKKRNFIKIIYLTLLVSFCLSLYQVNTASAANPPIAHKEDLENQTTAFLAGAGFNPNATLGGIIAAIIKGTLGLLGIIFIIILIFAGFKWMNARGNEDEAKKALDMIRMAIIGLIIIVAAYSVTFFVFSRLDEATGSRTTPSNTQQVPSGGGSE